MRAALRLLVDGGRRAVQSFIERLLFACRWLLVPLYILLAVSLFELRSLRPVKAYSVAVHLLSLDSEGVLLSVLGLVDLTLTGSLVVIVFISGYTNFVAPVAMRESDGRPHWIAEIDFGELKVKLMASIVAISAVKLLEGFMDDPPPERSRARLAPAASTWGSSSRRCCWPLPTASATDRTRSGRDSV